MRRTIRKVFFVLMILGCLLPAAAAKDWQQKDTVLPQIRIAQNLGGQLPLETAFLDEQGQTVRLGDFFGSKPVLITPVYYECPMLCGLVLQGLLKALRVLDFKPGREFDIVTFSIDPRETPDLASAKKKNVLKFYGHAESGDGWHFLTSPGSAKGIAGLTEALGFHYALDEKTGQYAHAAALMIATPAGKISAYFTGIEFAPRDLKFALMQASRSRIGSWVDQALIYCYHYDPATGKYGLAVTRILRMAGMLTVMVLGTFILGSLRKEKTKA